MEDLKKYKIFARNLTARADHIVRGNPITSRPEDGVENCFPGLEFDQRNLDKAFFPGLLFELHHSGGVILREFHPDSPASKFFTSDDINKGIFLIFLQGFFTSHLKGATPQRDIYQLGYPAGLDAWRIIRDVEPGEIAIALCDRTVYERMVHTPLDIDETVNTDTFGKWAENRTNRTESSPGVGTFTLLFDNRAIYLTSEGVIDPQYITPGDLTRSLCSPWQYDFADCGCFYWAANKPDLVSNQEQPEKVLNFQRRNRSIASDLATTPDKWITEYEYRWDDRKHIYNHAEMLSQWTKLPVVLDGREGKEYIPPTLPAVSRLLSRHEIINRLKRLAPVEHALAIEYLYAYYSLAQPIEWTESNDNTVEQRIFNAARGVFNIAIDEMRHLRTVNEILIELGESWVLDRAAIIGEDFDNNGIAFERPYELKPLTADQLDWFIAVEKPSQSLSGEQDTIDGMYTLILYSIQESGEFTISEKHRLCQLIKAIIDEGMDHYRQFLRVKELLKGIPENRYLKVFTAPQRFPINTDNGILQNALDASYVVVLRSLDFVFSQGDEQRGAMLEASRRAMYNMDDAARLLSIRGIGATFDMTGFVPIAPSRPKAKRSRVTATMEAKLVGEPLRSCLEKIQTHDTELKKLTERMDFRLNEMTQSFEALMRKN